MTVTVTASIPGVPPVHPRLMLGWEASRPARTIVHEPLFPADADPIVTLATPGAKRGRLTYFFATASDAAACWAMHMELAVFTLDTTVSNTATQLRYVVAEGDIIQRLDTDSQLAFTVEVPYLEVPA